MRDEFGDIGERLRKQEEEMVSENACERPRRWYPTGFPQGANISPFLSILKLLEDGDPEFARLVMYADDGIFYSDKKFEVSDVEEFFLGNGIEIAPEKSK